MREAERHGKVNVLDLLKGEVRRHGGEFHSPCPWCGGDDRFVVWPEKPHGGRFWCRQCGRMGDCVDLLRSQGYTFKQAVDMVGTEVETSSRELIDSLPGIISKAQDEARRELETLSGKDRDLRVELRYLSYLEGAPTERVLRVLRRAYDLRDDSVFEYAHRLLGRRLRVALKIVARFDELYPAQAEAFLRSEIKTTRDDEFERLGMDSRTESMIWDS